MEKFIGLARFYKKDVVKEGNKIIIMNAITIYFDEDDNVTSFDILLDSGEITTRTLPTKQSLSFVERLIQ